MFTVEPITPVEIHTYDRIAFKRCRRKWNWSSPLRNKLTSTVGVKQALWFGSGIHFALEDYHGYRKFQDPVDAFVAYTKAFKDNERPLEWEELTGLAAGMLDYYTTYWLPRRDEFKTLWVDGRPQVEVEFSILLPEVSERVGYPVYYHGTFDRVVVDSNGELWIEDYKTAATFNTSKLETDPQISAYLWAAQQLYSLPVAGMLYLQMIKEVPSGPRLLANGEYSQDKRQRTPHVLYRAALIQRYGEIPKKYQAFLDLLIEQETFEGDKFIRWDKVYRSAAARDNEYIKICAEAIDMLSPEIFLYPNPTRDCSFDCDFRTVCLTMDDDADWEYLIENMFECKEDRDEWRKRIKYPA